MHVGKCFGIIIALVLYEKKRLAKWNSCEPENNCGDKSTEYLLRNTKYLVKV